MIIETQALQALCLTFCAMFWAFVAFIGIGYLMFTHKR